MYMEKPLILTGKVVHGKALGRTVGMPTANLCIESGELPEEGVYVTTIYIERKAYASVTNVGRRPTVDCCEDITVETFILDFGQDIYGKTVELEIGKFLRPIQKFNSLAEVQMQVKKDCEEAKKYLDIGFAK